MSVNGKPSPAAARPRLWWWLVIASAVCYVLLMAGHYLLIWHTSGTLILTTAKVLLVASAVFAAARDLSAAGPRRPLRSTERIALMSAVVLVLLWLTGLTLSLADTGWLGGVLQQLTGLIVTFPVIPIAALALPGTIIFRR